MTSSGASSRAAGSSYPAVYLAGLHLEGRSVVLVGGGRVVARRLETLLAAGALVRVIAPWVDPRVGVAAQAGRITWEARRYAPGDLAACWYAMACTDDPLVNAQVVAEAESRRLFCVRADAGGLGQAVTPASGRCDHVQFALTTGGDYRLSRRLRDELAARLRQVLDATGSGAGARGDRSVDRGRAAD